MTAFILTRQSELVGHDPQALDPRRAASARGRAAAAPCRYFPSGVSLS
jgi:hypothetical protein